jgi:hypothetical protein
MPMSSGHDGREGFAGKNAWTLLSRKEHDRFIESGKSNISRGRVHFAIDSKAMER